MQYSKSKTNDFIKAKNIKLPEERRNVHYYCIECNQEVEFVFIQHGDNYFRHKIGHKLCVWSSIAGGSRTKEKDMRDYLTVHTAVQNLFETYLQIKQIANFHWRSLDTEIYLLPQYYPEKRLIKINEKVSAKNGNLLLIIPNVFDTERLDKAIIYRNYLYKVHAIQRYAYDHSIPNRLIITDGKNFYQLTNPSPWWSKKRKEYLKTIFKYDFEMKSFNSLL